MSENTLDNTCKRLIFRAGHRGTKEMDLLLGSFALRYVPGFSEGELAAFDDLLQENDPDLYNWITGTEAAPERAKNWPFFPALKAHRYKAA